MAGFGGHGIGNLGPGAPPPSSCLVDGIGVSLGLLLEPLLLDGMVILLSIHGK